MRPAVVRTRAPAALALMLTTSAATASAQQTERVRFAWARAEGAEGCADAAALARSVTARLARNPFDERAPRIVEGLTTASAAGFVATVWVREVDGRLIGKRSIASRASTCASLDAAMVLAIALLIDPEGALAPRSVLRPAPSADPPTPQRDASAAGDRALASLRLLVTHDVLPSMSAGLGASFSGALTGPLAWSLDLRFHPELRSADPGDFAFGLAAIGPGACARFDALRWLEVEGCASAWVGALHTVVFRPTPTDPGQRLWLAASGTMRARIRLLPALSLEVGGELLFPLIRHRFRVEGRTSIIFEQGPVLPGASVGLSVHFL